MEFTLGVAICMLQENKLLRFTNGNTILYYDVKAEYLALEDVYTGVSVDEIYRLTFEDKWKIV